MAGQPERGARYINRHREKRFAWKRARVTKSLKLAGAMDMEKKLPNNDADGELNSDQLLVAERVAAALFGGGIRICDIIQPIKARDILKRLVLLPA